MRGSSDDLILQFFGELDKVGDIARDPYHQTPVLLWMPFRLDEDVLILAVNLNVMAPSTEVIIDKVKHIPHFRRRVDINKIEVVDDTELPVMIKFRH